MKIRLQCTEGTKGSASLKALSNVLSQRVGYKVFRSILPKHNRLNLSYGQSVDKLTQYRWFQQQGLSALEFTTDRTTAREWFFDEVVVFGRKYLNSSCGKGIVVFEENALTDVPDNCPVYTKYKKKKREFRVHVFKDQVVAVTEKKRRSGYEGQRDTKIRNLANGYVFVQSVTNEPEGLRELALAASRVSPSDFKGVDIGYNEQKDDLFVIEVNSAPGMQGSNIEAYANAVLEQCSSESINEIP